MIMKEDIITIIIPCYNAERYIKDCILSALCQSYRNIEVCVINDGSTDQSFSVCEEIARRDDRIHLYTQSNKGVAIARNTGIQNANGQYVFFLDADDLIDENCITKLYQIQKNRENSIAVCSYHKFTKLLPSGLYDEGKIQILQKEEYFKKVLNLRQNMYLWGALIPRVLFNDVSFEEDMICFEDLDTVYKIVEKSSGVCLTSERLLFYRQCDSTITKDLDKEKIRCYYRAVRGFERFIHSYYSELDYDFRIFKCYVYIQILGTEDIGCLPEIKTECQEYLKKNLGAYLYSDVEIKEKMKAMIIKNQWLYKKIRMIVKAL